MSAQLLAQLSGSVWATSGQLSLKSAKQLAQHPRNKSRDGQKTQLKQSTQQMRIAQEQSMSTDEYRSQA
jgi:hypothetical protein